MTDKPVVVLTGFGPFEQFTKNASWEVAKAVSIMGLEEELGIKLIIKEIEVSYPTVTSVVPKLWENLQPILVIHLGVSAAATKLTIESCAHKRGYNRCDVDGKLPYEGECCHGKCDNIKQQLDLDTLVTTVNRSLTNISAEVSSNAGRYLCEYIYYTSLSINERSALFVHVPDIDKPYSLEQMAEGIKLIITSALDQLRKTSEVKDYSVQVI